MGVEIVAKPMLGRDLTASALVIRYLLPDSDIGQHYATNGIGVICEQVELAQLILESLKLRGGPATLNHAFPNWLQGTGQHGLSAQHGAPVCLLARQTS